MKKLCCLCLLAAALAIVPPAANAEKLDMGKFTCGELLKLDGDEGAMVYFWLDGYVSHMTGNNVIDTGTMEADITALMEMCQKNLGMKILDMFKGR